MTERVFQRLSLAGQVIEDLTHQPLRPGRFRARIEGLEKGPEYKSEGLFVFSDLRAGGYDLEISGRGYQIQQYGITLPFAPLVFDQPGDNELALVVKTVNGGSKKIGFDPVNLGREIKAGASVRGTGFSGLLDQDLEPGEHSEAKLNNVTGISAGDLLRIIRDRGIRLRFDPYAPLPLGVTRIVGKVVRKSAPEVPVEGALVRVRKINGVQVVLTTVAGAKIVNADLAGGKVVLGAERDITTNTNSRGDYNLYFVNTVPFVNVTLRVTMDGYGPKTSTRPLTPGQRTRIDFQLTLI